MHYPDPIDRNEKLRRKWWKFLVANGAVTPAVKITTRVSRVQGKSLKRRSACNGEGTQFTYNARTGEISGFFRECNIAPSFKNNSNTRRLFECFISIVRQGYFLSVEAETARDKKRFRERYKNEIQETTYMWETLEIERQLLLKIENCQRRESGRREISLFFTFSFSKDFLMMPLSIESIRKIAKQDLDILYYTQIKILQKLISKKQPHKTS